MARGQSSGTGQSLSRSVHSKARPLRSWETAPRKDSNSGGKAFDPPLEMVVCPHEISKDHDVPSVTPRAW
jgi:hypothetical protein